MIFNIIDDITWPIFYVMELIIKRLWHDHTPLYGLDLMAMRCVCVCSTEGYPDQRNYMQVRSSLLASLVECHLGSDSVEQLGAVPKSHGTHKLYYEGVKYTYKPYRIELWPCIIYYLCIAHQIGLSTDRWFLWTIFLSMLPTLFTFINTHFFINCH
jgi:hypothetical protein